MQLERINHLPADFDELVNLAEAEQFTYLKQMKEEWDGGSNTFSKDGEALFAITEKGKTLGICGLNRDVSESENIGLVRHMYVRPENRGQKIGERLLIKVIKSSLEKFPELRLKSEGELATEFYQRFGFSPLDEEKSTYFWKCH